MLDRRHLLHLATACAGMLWLPRGARADQRFGHDPFQLGVASGAPTHEGVVLWTRLLAADGAALGGGERTLQWEVAHDESFVQIAQRGQAQAVGALAHSAHVEVAGLAPDRWYFYRFIAGGVASPVGRTRTLPAPDALVGRLRVAYASCQRWEHGYYAAYRQMREDAPDLVLFLGDYIYEYPDAQAPARKPPGQWVLTLDDYRQRHALHKSDADLQRMHAACPWLVTWDDHEVQNDYAGLQAGQAGPAVVDFAARRAAAYQAYYEHMPLPASALVRAFAELRLHGVWPFGRLASLVLLDARQFKSPQACTPGGRSGGGVVDPGTCPVLDDPARSLLGMPQEAWLDQTLARQGRTPVWNILGQQTLFGRCDRRTASGHRVWNDGWDGYAPARRRLTDALQRHAVSNPVLLGGDVHQNWVGHVLADYGDPGSRRVGVEFCGTSLTSRSGAQPQTAELLAQHPHFVLADAQRRGYGLADFTPAQLEVRLRVVDDVTRPDARVQTLAQFTVPAGQPVLERV